MTGRCDACGRRLQRLNPQAPVVESDSGRLHRHPFPWHFLPDR